METSDELRNIRIVEAITSHGGGKVLLVMEGETVLKEISNPDAWDAPPNDVTRAEAMGFKAGILAQTKADAARIAELEGALPKLPPLGAEMFYVYDAPELPYEMAPDRKARIRCVVIGYVEGWVEVQCDADGSTAIVRPSRLKPRAALETTP